MSWLKEHTYVASTDSGRFLLSYQGLLRLDETMSPDVLDSLIPAYPAPFPDAHLSDQSLVITGDETLSTDVAAALRQCGLNVRVAGSKPAAAEPDHGLLCHVAAHDDGLCWSFADVREASQVAPLLADSRRAASDGPGPQIPYQTLIGIAAKQIAHHVLRSSPARPPSGVVTFLNGQTLRTSTHHVTVHPYDVPAKQRTRDEFRCDLSKLRDDPPLSRPELTDRWQRLSDERFGALAGLDETNFRQLPLKVTLTRLSDPCGLLSTPPAVVGVGIDRDSARERAILQALAAYGSIVVDPRLLVDQNGTLLGPREGDPTRLLRPVRDGSVDAFVRAVDLTDGCERLLPARQAFPVLRTREPLHTPCGTSAAPDWHQALTHGLLQHCVRLTVSASSFPARPHRAVAVEEFDQDPEVGFLAAMVRAAGIDLTLHDITGPAGIPVVACTSTSEQTVYGGGVHLVDAVREALTAALFRFQLRCDPALNAAMSMPTSAFWTSSASLAALSPDRLVHALTSMGYTPSVVALDHDRAVHEAFPYVLRVIMTGSEQWLSRERATSAPNY